MRIQPKKRLGQNFLFDKNVQRKIIEACGLGPGDIVLEIGSGRGELTEHLIMAADKVFAVELDKDLCQLLSRRFAKQGNFKIINQDILKLDFSKYFKDLKGEIKIIGNIPYYISSPIIEHLARFREKISVIFLTLQKEFAERLSASPGSKRYGAFSCFVQYYFEPEILFNIKKTSFHPSPKVDSAFVKLQVRPSPLVITRDEKLLFRIIRNAFGQRRKTLRNSLKDVISCSSLERFFLQQKISPNTRPEELSLQDFSKLSDL
ncbi:MAG: 16S rRNA (adenine(1518)-N(6)/adenine(1519)-N(6))-dimethyltransferase RsmA [Candidatus Omnitrophota bacterium]